MSEQQLQPEAPPDGPAIVVQDLHRSFGVVEALRGVTLHVPFGAVTGLVGPNGAGKTTLMLILATLLTADSGEVRVAGLDPRTSPEAVRATIGWMPDTLGVHDQLTCAEYLTFFARAHRLPPAVAAARTTELLASMHLAGYSAAPVHVLSRGQKQRLAMARAMIHHPTVLLLDEPASGLDPHSRIELRALLRSLAASGVAVLVSSHILSELEEMADGVVLMSGGRTVHEGTLEDLSATQPTRWRVRGLDLQALTAALNARSVPYESAGNAGLDLPPMSESDAADLLATLVSDGVRITAFGPQGSQLESAYLTRTQGWR